MNDKLKPICIGYYKYPNSDKQHQSNSIFDINGICRTLDAGGFTRQVNIMEVDKMSNIRIRKLTPTECYKLQGFTVEDCKKASDAGVSNSQLYKQAGNSICVSVLEAIYKSLSERYDEFRSIS